MDQNNQIKKILNSVKEFADNKYSANEKFTPNKTFIPASGKVIDHEEIGLMVQASLDGWLTTGRFNEEFQKKLSSFLGVKHLLTTNSGSSANLLAFTALTSPKLKERAI